MAKQRPTGFNGKPIPFGRLYSDYTEKQIEAIISDHAIMDMAERKFKAAMAKMESDADSELRKIMYDSQV